ncbi:MAG: autoinducer binding domain-containing protein, partial [Sphingomonas sp.]
MSEAMRLRLLEELGHEVSTSTNNNQLSRALTYARRRMGFDHFAVIYDQWIGCTSGPSLLIHDYPDQWANAYISFGLGNRDLAGQITREWYERYRLERDQAEARERELAAREEAEMESEFGERR